MSDGNPLPHAPLSIVEARVLGCLMEKEVTTPDYYPLSLNALVNACNQKSNRNPVMELDEKAVEAALESLRYKQLAFRVSQAESRVAKFKHSLDRVYPVPDPQQAILAELLIRGPQTPGELRTRCERMHKFESLDEVKSELLGLATGNHPIVLELPRQPGRKDARFAHLLSGPPDLETPEATSTGPLRVDVSLTLPPEAEERIAQLEATVAQQADTLAALLADFEAFRKQFE